MGCYRMPAGSARAGRALRMVKGLANLLHLRPPRAAPPLSLPPRPQPSDRTTPTSTTYTFRSEAQSSLSIESASCCRRASSVPTSCPEREGGRLVPGHRNPSGGHEDLGTDRRRPRLPGFWLQRAGRYLPNEDSARYGCGA